MNRSRPRALIAVVAFSLFALSCAARSQDYSDIWWSDPLEDGWGMNLIQSQDFIFATFFVYGPAPATAPTWYAANLYRQSNGTFSGGVYATTGTGIGAPWNPADHPPATQVGNATFTPTSSATGTLNYNVNGVNVSKSIRRQTLTTIKLSGSYIGTAVIHTTGCTNTGSNKTQYFDADPIVSQTIGVSLSFQLAFDNEVCTLSGPSLQEGLLSRIPNAAYVCNSGAPSTLNTTATVYEVKATSTGIEGRWSASNVGGGCREDGTFSAVLP